MKILLLTAYFPPEIGTAGHLFYEMAETLSARGNQVTVVTGFPRYNMKESLPQYQGKLCLAEEMAGFRVLRMWWPPAPRSVPFLRGIEHFVLSFALFLRGLFSGSQDIVLVYSPPLPLGLTAYGLSRVRRLPYVVNVQDLFPQEAVELGFIRNPFLIWVLEKVERFIYRTADCIALHTIKNSQHVIEHGGVRGRIRVIHNWVDVEQVKPSPKDNWFRQKHGLDGLFVVSYAGTMGWAQDVAVIVKSAALLLDQPEICFLLVGDGMEKANAEAQAKRSGLHNVMFLPMQPWKDYPDILAASDVSMINLKRKLTTPVVPSKLMNIMAAGRPVVASLPLDGDAPRIVREAGCGICVEAEDAESLAGAIRKLFQDESLREQMGKKGRRYAEEHFGREQCVGQYEQLFREVRSRWRK